MQKEKGFTDNWLQPTGAKERLLRQYAGALATELSPALRPGTRGLAVESNTNQKRTAVSSAPPASAGQR
jgi:hypothetical protein